jgi:hypothetical protein
MERQQYIGPMEMEKIHRSNGNGKNYIALMKMENYIAIETLVCIVVLTVLPHMYGVFKQTTISKHVTKWKNRYLLI